MLLKPKTFCEGLKHWYLHTCTMLETALKDVKFRFLNFYDVMCKPRISCLSCC